MYHHVQINDHTYKIIDSYQEAMYLIIGSQRALLIDAGMDLDSLYDYVRMLTDKEIDLVLSHGHIDHVGASGEFKNVYMSSLDHDVYMKHMNMNVGHFKSDGLRFKDVSQIQEMKHVFDLGNRYIYAYPLPGHTPGSYIFIDDQSQCIYTGDALGSGCGCWLQLDEALTIEEYLWALTYIVLIFESKNVDESWHFYGGHDGQEYQSRVSSYNRFDIQLVYDMKMLCLRLLEGKQDVEEVHVMKATYTPCYASFQKAELIMCREKISV